MRGVLQRAGTDRARSAARGGPGRCAHSSGLLDLRNRTAPVLTPACLERNHRDQVPNHKVPGLPSRKGLDQCSAVLELGPNRMVPAPVPNHRDRGPSSADLDPNHRDRALPNHRDLVLPSRQARRRIRRVRRTEDQVLHRRQVLIHMPALGRTVVGCWGRGSARADHATAVVPIQWGAAANSSITPVALGDRVVKLHVSV